MPDPRLPAEGEIVLCGFHDRGHPDHVVVSVYRDGRWCHRKSKAAHPHPDWWVPLPLARRAREMEAALRAIAECDWPEGTPDDMDVHQFARAALEDTDGR